MAKSFMFSFHVVQLSWGVMKERQVCNVLDYIQAHFAILFLHDCCCCHNSEIYYVM